ncbi:NAD(P)/FAD-dependent oxidoreductase [Winogradskyella maritima]|uniref:Dihydrolipoyl dehydrogenase family protein n=1 Tax=Winogradskyella maritima TaxID=1517766 RepID=A0ABV8AH02_9FLAO|nr:NAD(P)/FAD-dependent oxidoreductase [Winogradskyella maritima]
MKPKHYDVFVIGSGIAGQTTAEYCAKHGKSVAVADDREFGGTCANRGCDPKKVLMQFADICHHIDNLQGLGIDEKPKINWKDVQKFKKQFTQDVPVNTEKNLKTIGIDLYHQSPKFIDENTIEVEGERVTADYFVIATGRVPRLLHFKGAQFLGTSDDVLNLKKVPKSAVFIGSGYVGMEMAYLLSSLGSKVTVIDQGTHALSQFDAFLTEKLVKSLEQRGITFIFEAQVENIESLRKNLKVTYISKGEEHSIKARKVFNSAGRIPATERLQINNANIDANGDGIAVNSFLQSVSNPKVYACGDVASFGVPLTPLSGLQGHIVGKNIVEGNTKETKDRLVPSVVFTQPNIAMVGLSEDEAKSRYKNIKVYKGDASDWFSSKKINEDTYAYIIITNARTEEIVGGQLLSSHGNETINLLSLAIHQGLTVSEFQSLIFTYPSFTNDLKYMLSD